MSNYKLKHGLYRKGAGSKKKQVTKKEKRGAALGEDFIKKLIIYMGAIKCLEIFKTSSWGLWK